MRRSVTLALLAAGMGASLLMGCAPTPPSPTRSLGALAQALRQGDAEAAHALMSSRYRERIPLAEFRRLMAEQPDEILATAEALEHPLAIEEEARVQLSSGEEIVLAREGDGWRVVTNVADAYAQASPRDAVRSFLRALERDRFDVVHRLLPEAERARWSVEALRATWRGEAREEIERLSRALRDAVDTARIEQTGDRAVMPYGARHRLILVREERGWVIESPE